MKIIRFDSKIDKDIIRCADRQLDIEIFNNAVDMLEAGGPIPRSYHPHPLKGKYLGFHSLTLAHDWRLLYFKKGDVIHIARTGSHSDLGY
ncbi:MAG: type II toxin-antitoxin system YafQ family toxin [Ruminococcus sp.]|jgi:mRNA interferase YafQ|nr:type II toxin-antitoxin system YafQ family toxin [Ruminococcus sp.]